MGRSHEGARSIVTFGVFALVAGLMLTGCTAVDNPITLPGDEETPVATPTPGETAVPTDPELVPSGTADDNKAYFDLVNKKLKKNNGLPRGRKIIDNLVDGGFDKKAMELTPDKTAIDLEADTVEFTVLIDDACLFGQWGSFGYKSTVLPVLSTGKCMIGKTRNITW